MNFLKDDLLDGHIFRMVCRAQDPAKDPRHECNSQKMSVQCMSMEKEWRRMQKMGSM